MDIIAIIVALIAILFTWRQVKISKMTHLLSGIRNIYEDNIKIRRLFDNAVTQRKDIFKYIEENKPNKEDINFIYGKNDFCDLREIGYHFELIGILVKRNVLPLYIIFDLIPFPDKFWGDSVDFIKVMREKYISDFWINFEYLKVRYEKERKKKNVL